MVEPKPILKNCLHLIAVALLTATILAGGTKASPLIIGQGKADVTGPAAELGMMGYANLDQKTSGIKSRIYARAFIFKSPKSGESVVFVSVDGGQMFHSVTQGVERDLRALYGDTYTQRNMIISATHSHSTPGGHSQFALYNITILGFNAQNYYAVKDGIVTAIRRAHEDLSPGTLTLASGNSLTKIGVNRSLEAFEKNPASKKQGLEDGTDTEMTLLKIIKDGKVTGILNWYGVHPVSVNAGNHLINGDNKGLASYILEQEQEGLIAAFAQSASGDVSPNLNLDGTGPGRDHFQSNRIIAERQVELARALVKKDGDELEDEISFSHTFVNLSESTVGEEFTTTGEPATTCTASMGVAFAAGTEDGRGPSGIFKEGTTEWNPIFQSIVDILNRPSAELRRCQAPKPILLAVGKAIPDPWVPDVVPMSIVKIGDLSILAIPAEMTVAGGRELSRLVEEKLGGKAVIAGLSNAYSSYVTTYDEYQAQNYEGGSTLYGPHTHAAYLQTFDALADKLQAGIKFEPKNEAFPRVFTKPMITLQTGVIFDTKRNGEQFGDALENPESTYFTGETVIASFRTGHPKNNLLTGSSFLEIQREVNGKWQTIATDDDWATSYHWVREGGPLSALSAAYISWRIPPETQKGIYRILHRGHSKAMLSGDITPFEGHSAPFEVLPQSKQEESTTLVSLKSRKGSLVTINSSGFVRSGSKLSDKSARFEMVYLANGEVALRHVNSRRYIEVNIKRMLVPGGKQITPDSRFELVEASKNRAYFKSVVTGRFLRVGRGGKVWADQKEAVSKAAFQRLYW